MRLHLLIVTVFTASQFAACVEVPDAPILAEAVGTYEVQPGDTIFAIADLFRLDARTIVLANESTLQGDPHRLSPGMILTILPIDGVYYQWEEGDSLESVAARFRVDPKAIVAWPGNRLNLEEYQAGISLSIPIGSKLIIPCAIGDNAEGPTWANERCIVRDVSTDTE